jgi:bla regulator protein BlaR1
MQGNIVPRWLCLILLCQSPLLLTAQSQTPPPQPPTTQAQAVNLPSFEVAAIKLNPSGGPLESWDKPPGRFTAKNISMRSLLAQAYELPANQIGGIPGSIESQHFDIEAKMSAEQFSAIDHLGKRPQEHQVDLMLQSLLADRFRLVVSHHPQQGKVLALIVARGGAKLIAAGSHDLPRLRPDKGPRSFSGAMLSDHDIPLSVFANHMSEWFGRPVVNETGLTGSYDILFEVPIGDDEDREAAIVTALEDQLGLSLKRQTGTVDTISVDHIELPSAN